MTKEISQFEEWGRESFRLGRKCAPALDPRINEWIKTEKPSHRRFMRCLSAWLRSWHKENLS